MKQLVNVKVDDFLLFEKVDQPVQDKFNNSQNVTAGDQPDPAGMNQRVCTEAIKPEGVCRQVSILWAGMSIFMECEKLSLEWMITQRMGNEQRKEDRNRSREVTPVKGIEVL